MPSKVRLDDSFYLQEDRRDSVKEAFKTCSSLLLDCINQNIGRNFRLLDVGCATGDFLWYAKSIFPSTVTFSGSDVRDDLLAVAQARMPDVAFHSFDISLLSSVCSYINSNGTHDLTFMSGVHPIFDDYAWLTHLSMLTSVRGTSLVFGPFGDAPYDVLSSVRYAGEDTLRSGWNTMSVQTLKLALDQLSRKSNIIVNDFVLPYDLPQQDDPKRAFTLNTLEHGRIQVNGLSMIRPQKTVLIDWD
jgi:hypothetical protein